MTIPMKNEPTMLVSVRKRGAIGKFYYISFPVMSKEEWFDTYSNEWELHHFALYDEYISPKEIEDYA